MTTEDDFQQMLDADPSDHVTRRVFADWMPHSLHSSSSVLTPR